MASARWSLKFIEPGDVIEPLKINGRYVFDIDMILNGIIEPPQTFRMLDVSLSHLPPEMRDHLNRYPGVIADERDGGWLLWVPKDVDEHLRDYTADDGDDVPADVIRIYRKAAEHNCQYVLLDRDARTVPGLTSYD